MGRRPREVVSYNMSQIRSKNTKLEGKLEEILKKTELHYEKYYDIVGKPDFAFPELQIAFFGMAIIGMKPRKVLKQTGIFGSKKLKGILNAIGK